MSATHEDAILIVEPAKLGAMTGVPDASRIAFAEDFDPDSVETSDASIQKVLNFTETIATLVKNDLLDRELVHDWLWITGIWERLGPLLSVPVTGPAPPRFMRTSRRSRMFEPARKSA